MRRLLSLFFLFTALVAGAQTRNYADNASGTFVFGLDSYFYGSSGSLEFDAYGEHFQASVSSSGVFVNGRFLEAGGDVVVGIHDFTEDRQPELVLAHRLSASSVSVSVYARQGGQWKLTGQMRGTGGVTEVRVFRQVVSFRRGDVLYSWTWHGSRFDFKASDGSPEP